MQFAWQENALKKWDEIVWVGFVWLRIWVDGCYHHINEPFGYCDI
jgi:hypothetical protein